ncbi:MAG: UDP-N-acetylmuramoyl-tripeptide--D-alanyl-D-alanine ligase [Clostridia bacterium]|nr:UDP-N-acetylmuramoyl-tripeptide--D-alanyl-D-alanine ligase [Clostridia bacterium]
MHQMTIGEAVRAVRGTLCAPGLTGEAVFRGITIDSRRVQAGDMFVPIVGERFDGHEFLPQAFDSGAVIALAHRDVGFAHIRVEDTTQAFLDLAEYYRSTLRARVIAVTGSVGKTTTKELICAALSRSLHVQKSAGNLNNQTGVPITLFTIGDAHDAAVVEMGTNHFGEIARIAKAGRPNICVFTNIGDAHIEFLGSREGVLRAKCEMLPYMAEGGRVIVNGDDPLLARLARSREGVVTCGFGEECAVRATQLRPMGLQGSRFSLRWSGGELEAEVGAPGDHMVLNALLAFAVGLELGVDPARCAEGILSYRPEFGRMRVVRTGGVTVLDDVYNANPTSVKASLDILARADGRKVAVLGDMLELGAEGARYHREVGEYAVRLGVDCIIAVGEHAEDVCAPANGALETHRFADREALLAALGALVRPGDTVLVKASRGLALEGVVAALENGV